MAPFTKTKKCAFYQTSGEKTRAEESQAELLSRYVKRRAEVQSELDAQNKLWLRMNRHRYIKQEELISERTERFRSAFFGFLNSNKLYRELQQIDQKIAWLERSRNDTKGQKL